VPTQKERKPTRKHGAEENLKKHVPPDASFESVSLDQAKSLALPVEFGGASGYQKLLPRKKTGDAVDQASTKDSAKRSTSVF